MSNIINLEVIHTTLCIWENTDAQRLINFFAMFDNIKVDIIQRWMKQEIIFEDSDAKITDQIIAHFNLVNNAPGAGRQDIETPLATVLQSVMNACSIGDLRTSILTANKVDAKGYDTFIEGFDDNTKQRIIRWLTVNEGHCVLCTEDEAQVRSYMVKAANSVFNTEDIGDAEEPPTDFSAPITESPHHNAFDQKGHAYDGIDIGSIDILDTPIDAEVGKHVQVVHQEQISGFDMGIEQDSEGVDLVEEYNDDETELICRHLTVTHRSLEHVQNLAHTFMNRDQYTHKDPTQPITVINNDVVGMDSFLGSSELNTLYKAELIQDTINLGVPSAQAQINELASFINTECPEEINVDGGAIDIAIGLIDRYLEIKVRLEAVAIIADEEEDLTDALVQSLRKTKD